VSISFTTESATDTETIQILWIDRESWRCYGIVLLNQRTRDIPRHPGLVCKQSELAPSFSLDWSLYSVPCEILLPKLSKANWEISISVHVTSLKFRRFGRFFCMKSVLTPISTRRCERDFSSGKASTGAPPTTESRGLRHNKRRLPSQSKEFQIWAMHRIWTPLLAKLS